MDAVELVHGDKFRVLAIRREADECVLVERYIQEQSWAQRLKLVYAINRFAARGPSSNPEKCKKLKGQAAQLIELKEKPSRLLGFYSPTSRGVLVLIHGFDKKSNATPAAELRRALSLREAYVRMVEQEGDS